MLENRNLDSINLFQNKSINLSMNSNNNSNINSPILDHLIEFGYNPIYSRGIFLYYHPRNLEEAIEYLSLENGIIQHIFVQDRNNIENNICYLCGENKNIHLNSNVFNSNNSNINNSDSSFNNNINNNIKNEENNEDNKKEINENDKNNIKNKNPYFNFSKLNDTFELLKKQKIKIQCNACEEMFCPNYNNTLQPCKHSFCNDCWYNFLSIKILENKLTSIKCLNYECQEKPDDNFIINLLNSNIKLIEKYKKFKKQIDIINDPNKKLCPFPNCDSYLELKDKNNKFVKCLNNHEFCYLCLNKPHGNSPCLKMSTGLVEYAKNNFIKKCPKCQIITEKYEGCNHITCAKCNHQWCWLCNGDYDPEHYNEGKCKGYQFFRPKNENEIKLAFEGKIELKKSQMQNLEDDFIDYFMASFNSIDLNSSIRNNNRRNEEDNNSNNLNNSINSINIFHNHVFPQLVGSNNFNVNNSENINEDYNNNNNNNDENHNNNIEVNNNINNFNNIQENNNIEIKNENNIMNENSNIEMNIININNNEENNIIINNKNININENNNKEKIKENNNNEDNNNEDNKDIKINNEDNKNSDENNNNININDEKNNNTEINNDYNNNEDNKIEINNENNNIIIKIDNIKEKNNKQEKEEKDININNIKNNFRNNIDKNKEIIKNDNDNEINNKIEINIIKINKNNKFKNIPEHYNFKNSKNISINTEEIKVDINNNDIIKTNDKFILKKNNKNNNKENKDKDIENINEPKSLNKVQKLLLIIFYIFSGYYFIINNIFLKNIKNVFVLILYFLNEIPYFIIQIYINLIMLIIYTIKDGFNSFIHHFYYCIKTNNYNSYKILNKLLYYIFVPQGKNILLKKIKK